MVLFAVLLLTACQSKGADIKEVKNVPAKVQDMITKQEMLGSKHNLYMISTGDSASYLVFRASGSVTSSVETDGDLVTFRLDTTGGSDKTELHVFELQRQGEDNMIQFEVNGKLVPLDTYLIGSAALPAA